MATLNNNQVATVINSAIVMSTGSDAVDQLDLQVIMLKIAELWADRIITGDKKYSDVPTKLKKDVKASLIEKGHPELAK